MTYRGRRLLFLVFPLVLGCLQGREVLVDLLDQVVRALR